MNYEQFMQECKAACRERHACQQGYEQLLRSGSVGEILATAANNWDDVWRSKFSDIVADNITRWFSGLEQEFHDAGFFINEECTKGIAVVSRPDRTLRFTGRARVYVFSKAHVVAGGGVQVYCRDAESEIELRDHAYGKIDAGRVKAYDWSEVDSTADCHCYDHTTVRAYGGTLHDHGHRRLVTANDVAIADE